MTDGAAGPAIEAVVFDWGGTLTPWHTIDPLASWRALLGSGADEQLVDRLARAELDVWLRAKTDHRSGRIEEAFELVGITPDAAQLAAFYRWWDEHSYIDPDAPGLLAALRERGLRVGVLSNTWWPRAEHERIFARDGVDHLIDGAVYSSEIAWTKPHAEAFRAVLDVLDVTDPARAVYVGDRLWEDVHGAGSLGMRTIHIPHSDIPEVQRGHVEGTPDAVAHRLADVLDIVEAWQSRA